jgi:hypothetical protein
MISNSWGEGECSFYNITDEESIESMRHNCTMKEWYLLGRLEFYTVVPMEGKLTSLPEPILQHRGQEGEAKDDRRGSD